MTQRLRNSFALSLVLGLAACSDDSGSKTPPDNTDMDAGNQGNGNMDSGLQGDASVKHDASTDGSVRADGAVADGGANTADAASGMDASSEDASAADAGDLDAAQDPGQDDAGDAGRDAATDAGYDAGDGGDAGSCTGIGVNQPRSCWTLASGSDPSCPTQAPTNGDTCTPPSNPTAFCMYGTQPPGGVAVCFCATTFFTQKSAWSCN